MDPTSFDELRPGTYDVQAARARHVGERRARLAQLPVAARLRRPAVRRPRRQGRRARALPGVQRLAHRGVVRRRTRPLHPARDPADLGPAGARRRSAPRRRTRAATRSRSPRTPCRSVCPSLHTDHWDPFWKACSDLGHDRQHAHRLVVEARDHRARRRADRRDDHAAADEHRAGRGRPHLLAGVQEVPRRHGRAVRGRHRLDPLLPRAHRPHVHDAQGVDVRRLRRQAAEPGVHGARDPLLHRGRLRRPHTRARSAPTASASRPTTRTATRSGPTRPSA